MPIRFTCRWVSKRPASASPSTCPERLGSDPCVFGHDLERVVHPLRPLRADPFVDALRTLVVPRGLPRELFGTPLAALVETGADQRLRRAAPTRRRRDEEV